jgi:hypothetical protein
VPLEQLALGPQCGFASSLVGNPLTRDDQWRKLELVASPAPRGLAVRSGRETPYVNPDDLFGG